MLRKPCFVHENFQEGDIKPTSYQKDLVAYTKAFCQKIERGRNEADDEEWNALMASDCKDSCDEANKTSKTAKKDETTLPMDKCIKLLEPHLAGFRKNYEENDDITSEISEFIPQQLIRMARFFPHKWTPLKRALLRSPLRDEVRKRLIF